MFLEKFKKLNLFYSLIGLLFLTNNSYSQSLEFEIISRTDSNDLQSVIKKCDNQEFWGKKKYLLSLFNTDFNFPPSIDISYSDFEDVFKTRQMKKLIDDQRIQRNLLIYLTLKECIFNSGKNLEDINFLLNSIIHQPLWRSPAHFQPDQEKNITRYTDGDFSPHIFSSEVGKVLSFVYFLLGDKLEEYNKGIKRNIENQLKIRLLNNVIKLENNYVKKSMDQEIINNLLPWIISNLYYTYLFLDIRDKEKLSQLNKIINIYLSSIPNDNSIDEGAIYWQAGFGRIFDILFIQKKLASGNLVYPYRKITEIAEFISSLHIKDNKFINYSDSNINANIYKKRIEEMACYFDSIKLYNLSRSLGGSNIEFNLNDIDIISKLQYEIFTHIPCSLNYTNILYTPPTIEYYPDNQLFIKRINNRYGDYLFFVKGGNNNVSHSHQDIGSFQLYYNGVPIIVDPGRENYGIDRFKNNNDWYIKSEFHGIPTINNRNQSADSYLTETDFSFSRGERNTTFVNINLSDTYGKKNKPFNSEFSREFHLEMDGSIRLIDKINARVGDINSYQVSFNIPNDYIEYRGNNTFEITNGSLIIHLIFEDHLTYSFDKLSGDDLFHNNWKNKLTRLTFLWEGKKVKFSSNFKFHVDKIINDKD